MATAIEYMGGGSWIQTSGEGFGTVYDEFGNALLKGITYSEAKALGFMFERLVQQMYDAQETKQEEANDD